MARPSAAEVVVLEKPMLGLQPGSRVLITTPARLKQSVLAVPWGEEKTVAAIKSDLAAEAGADGVCPLTTGIFMRVLSEAAWEEHLAGQELEDVAPFWRVVRPDSPLGKKLSCGTEFLRLRRESEGLKS